VRVSTIQRHPTALHDLVTQFAQEMTAVLTMRGITLHLDGLVQLGTVTLHPNTFRRALLNLVHNAMDAMPQGGTLTLRGRRNATTIQLDVSDTGSGISPTQHAQIFEPLYTTKPGGTGLGLFIVQEIVAAHDGQVTMQSTVGHGTTFTITLPLAEAREAM
jgi:signal transduction histidine kinase